LWVSETADDTVVEIDPEARTIVATIPLDISVGAITASDDAVFVTDRDGGTLTRIDMADPSSPSTSPVADLPTRPEVGAGGLWLLSPDAGTLHRYDTETLAEIQVVDVEGVLGGLAIDGDDLWVTRFDADELVRVTVGS
jgi:streptogramin lyase